MKYLLIIFLSFFLSYPICAQQTQTDENELDDDITVEKKSLIILTAAYDEDQEVAERVLSIISDQATSLGRFEIIDRNLVDQILEEQEFQLSGMVDENQVARIGELASAENALILDVVNFGQKGVPKEDDEDEEYDEDEEDETLFSWLVKKVVTESIDEIKKKDTMKIRLELENNIHTEFRGSVKIVNVETGISENSFSISASHTGGNRDASLEKVLKILSSQLRRKLKELYMITSEVFEIDGAYLNMLSGDNLGLRKGTMFEIASNHTIKTYKGKKLKMPGKTRGLVKIVDVGPEGSKARIIRKWRKIKEGHRAYELKAPPITTDLNFTVSTGDRYELSGKAWLNSFSEFTASINYHLGVIRDTRDNMDGYIGFGTDLKYGIFSGFGANGYLSLNLPFLFAGRGDDDGNNVISIFSDPSIDANLAVQISKERDVVLSASYVFTSMHGPWQWQKDTGSRDEDGSSITETEYAVWDDNMKPEFRPKGFYISISLRRLRF